MRPGSCQRRSGSEKSTALHLAEEQGYLLHRQPAGGLLPELARTGSNKLPTNPGSTAKGRDQYAARTCPSGSGAFSPNCSSRCGSPAVQIAIFLFWLLPPDEVLNQRFFLGKPGQTPLTMATTRWARQLRRAALLGANH